MSDENNPLLLRAKGLRTTHVGFATYEYVMHTDIWIYQLKTPFLSYGGIQSHQLAWSCKLMNSKGRGNHGPPSHWKKNQPTNCSMNRRWSHIHNGWKSCPVTDRCQTRHDAFNQRSVTFYVYYNCREEACRRYFRRQDRTLWVESTSRQMRTASHSTVTPTWTCADTSNTISEKRK